jgi:hypothetical protein
MSKSRNFKVRRKFVKSRESLRVSSKFFPNVKKNTIQFVHCEHKLISKVDIKDCQQLKDFV